MFNEYIYFTTKLVYLRHFHDSNHLALESVELSRRTTNISRCLNLGSYNYLGFAAADEYCTPRVIDSMKKFSPSTCSTRTDGGNIIITKSHLHIFLLIYELI